MLLSPAFAAQLLYAAFVFATVPASTGSFQKLNNDWCWFSNDLLLIETLTYTAPLGAAVLYCLSVFFVVMWNLRSIREAAQRTRDPLNVQLFELTNTLKFYPLVRPISELLIGGKPLL